TATGDRRNSGSFASLAGLESATTEQETEAVINRILMGVALMASFGGLPLLYMGDEVGLTNDYDFVKIPDHAHDNRWLHRPKMPWGKRSVVQQKFFDGTQHIIARRKATAALAASNPTRIVDCGTPAIFCFLREGDEGPLLAMFNFSDIWQNVPIGFARAQGIEKFWDELSEGQVAAPNDVLQLPPHARLWLT
ncbi:MAG: hypothetical protein ABJA10_10940, partial [Aestuariivirga sp.]